MTKVELYRADKTIYRVVVSGHALFDEYGHDIVCAGISTVVTGILNALEELTPYNTSQVVFRPGYVEIPHLTEDEKVQWTVQVFVIQLKTIAMKFPDYIEILDL